MSHMDLSRFLTWITVTIACTILSFCSTSVAFELPDSEFANVIDYAELSHAAYHPSQPFHHNAWQRIDGGEKLSGLKWTLFERRTAAGRIEQALAFAGTDDLADVITDIDQAIPNTLSRPAIPPRQYREALAIANRFVKRADQDKNVTLIMTGHSLGGGLAQYTAAKIGVRGIVFNAAALGQDTLRDLAPPLRTNTSRQILNIYLQGDPVHDTTQKIFNSRQLGVNYKLKPAPGLPGIFPIDLPLLSPVKLKERGQNIFARHNLRNMIASLKYEQAYGDIRQQVEARPASGQPSAPVPSWWTIAQKNKPQATLLAEAEHLTGLAHGAKKVLIVGRGPATDLMVHRVRTKLGTDQVVRMPYTDYAAMYRRAKVVGADLILGVQPQRAPSAGVAERFLVPRTVAEHFATTVNTTATALHELGLHARTKDKTFQRLLNPGKSGVLKHLERAQNLYGLSLAIEQDLALASQGNFALLRSHTVEQAARIGLNHLTPKFFDVLKKHKIVRQEYPTFGALEALTGAARHVGSGRADIETVTHYFDAANNLAWSMLGLVSSGGNAKVASVFQSVGDTSARVLRDATQPLFTTGFSRVRNQPQLLENMWRTVQERRVHDNLPIQKIGDVFGSEAIRTSGFSKAHLSRLNQAVQGYEQQRLSQHQRRHSPSFGNLSEASMPRMPRSPSSRGGIAVPNLIRPGDVITK